MSKAIISKTTSKLKGITDTKPVKKTKELLKGQYKDFKETKSEFKVQKIVLSGILLAMGIFLIYKIYKMVHYLSSDYNIKSFGKIFEYDGGIMNTLFTQSKFGLMGNDVLDFDINIRTVDASDDCRIQGEYMDGRVTDLRVRGEGSKCTKLRKDII